MQRDVKYLLLVTNVEYIKQSVMVYIPYVDLVAKRSYPNLLVFTVQKEEEEVSKTSKIYYIFIYTVK
jgi:hypothetical protein